MLMYGGGMNAALMVARGRLQCRGTEVGGCGVGEWRQGAAALRR